MYMPTPSNVSGLGYSWGFASSDIAKGESDGSNNLSYTLGNTLTATETALTVTSHKSPQSQDKAIGGNNRRTMFLVNDSFSQTGHRTNQQTHNMQGNIPGKHFMTPLGPIQLTAEECNEILMKRALQAAQGINGPQTVIDASQLNHTILNGGIKGLTDGMAGVVSSQDSQQNLNTVQLIQTKQEPGTNSHSPKNHPITLQKERPFSCDECGKSFLLKHHLTTHSRVHTGERPHVCAHCGKAFAHKHCLNTHLLLHSNERPFQCHECKKSFTLKHHLLTHSRVHSRERPFVCGECGRGFPLKRHLVTHTKFHAGERPFVCQECGESFAQKDHLVMHSRFHGSLNPFVCGDCGVAFTRKFQLVNHGRMHGRVPHACPICGKEFLQKRTLIAHLKLHNDDASYVCIDCGEAFKGKADMLQHCKVVHSVSGMTTPPGNTQTVSVSQQTSTVTHTTSQDLKPTLVQGIGNSRQKSISIQVIGQDPLQDNKPPVGYSCQECGNCFNTKEALALHVRLHTGDRTFVTDLCALTAALQNGDFLTTTQQQQASPGGMQLISNPSTAILQHGTHGTQTQNNITGVSQVANHPTANGNRPKVHFCADCGKGFAARHGLQQHNRRHPDGACTLRTHVCDTCGKAFFQKNHLLLHQRQHMDLPPRNQQNQQSQQQQTELVQSQQQQQQQQQLNDVSHQNDTSNHSSSGNLQQHPGPTHIQVTNREGQVIGNQILIGGTRNRQIIGNQIHIINRDGKTIGTQISSSSNLVHTIKQEHIQNNRDNQAMNSQQQQLNANQHQQGRDNSHQLGTSVHHQSVQEQLQQQQQREQQQQQQQQLVGLHQHKDHLTTTSSGHLVLRNSRGVDVGNQQLSQLNQVHIGSHVIKYEIIPQSGVVQVQSLD